MFTDLTSESLARFRELYFALAPDYPHSVLLDSCGSAGAVGGFYMMGFEALETVRLPDDNRFWINGKPGDFVPSKNILWQELASRLPMAMEESSPGFTDGWIGTIGYELNHLLEPAVPFRPSENPFGRLYLVRFRHRILWHSGRRDFRILSPDSVWKERVESLLNRNAIPENPTLSAFKPLPLPEASLSPAEFESRVLEIQRQIQTGNLYQANLSIRFQHREVSPILLPLLYRELVNRNPSPFSGILWTPEGIVLSNSPERLVKYDAASNILETRPIAGTRGRGKTHEEEEAIGRLLQTNDKEQAEHMMLLDLERNDIGRVARPGSVHVPEALALERYSHVTHIVSQVEGEKLPDKTPWHVLESMFPGGTITGCPKVRCMQVLRELEPVPRGLYTGSLGYIDSCGNMDFNILIRSLFHWPDHRLHYHAGAGIVADSVPAWEYRECLRKAEVIQGALCYDHQTHYA